jgi:hypothetical protein
MIYPEGTKVEIVSEFVEVPRGTVGVISKIDVSGDVYEIEIEGGTSVRVPREAFVFKAPNEDFKEQFEEAWREAYTAFFTALEWNFPHRGYGGAEPGSAAAPWYFEVGDALDVLKELVGKQMAAFVGDGPDPNDAHVEEYLRDGFTLEEAESHAEADDFAPFAALIAHGKDPVEVVKKAIDDVLRDREESRKS